MATMMHIKAESAALFTALQNYLDPEKRPEEIIPVDVRIADFDDVHFRIEILETDFNSIFLSMVVPFWKDLVSGGVDEHLRSVYGTAVIAPRDGSNVSLQIKINESNTNNWSTNTKLYSSLRKHALAAPFIAAIKAVESGKGADAKPLMVHYRPQQPVFILPRNDRVTVIYSLFSIDQTDRATARIIAQEFVESTRQVANAPPCGFVERDREPPQELRPIIGSNMSTFMADNFVGFLSFAVFPRHFDNATKKDASVTQLSLFLTYLDYHIKAAKSYLHQRMRVRVDGWMQVLNRAVPETPFNVKEKKLASGRTFIQQPSSASLK